MTLAERLSEYVRACFTGIWVQSFEHDDAIVEIARLCRQQRWSLATWDIDRGLSIAGADESSSTAIAAADPLAAIKAIGSLATPGRHGVARPAELSPVPGQHRGRSGTRHGDRRRQAEPDDHRDPLARRPDPERTGTPVRRHRARSASSRADPADRPLHRHRARRVARRGRSRCCARRRGWADPGRGRERVLALADPPRPGYTGRAVGTQGPDAQEKRADDDPPRRRDVRRPGRPGRPEGVLPAIPDRQDGHDHWHVPEASCCSAFQALARARSARPWATRSGVPR